MSNASATIRRRPTGRSAGFTLAELIVVIGIILLLMAILLPAVNRVYSSGERAAQRASLNSIATALETYQSDFGDYPRFDTREHPSSPNLDDTEALNYRSDRGARLLARALFGPAPKSDLFNETPDEVTLSDLLTAFQDGFGDENGLFGFKADRQAIRDPETGAYAFYLPGDTYGPYLEAERWSLRKNADGEFEPDVVILDRNGQPILYYPALRSTPDLTVTFDDETFAGGTRTRGGFVSVNSPTMGSGLARQDGLYNAADNHLHLAARQVDDETNGELNVMLGDLDRDGALGPGETAAYTGPFLLIASDDDGEYGVNSVANFEPFKGDVE